MRRRYVAPSLEGVPISIQYCSKSLEDRLLTPWRSSLEGADLLKAEIGTKHTPVSIESPGAKLERKCRSLSFPMRSRHLRQKSRLPKRLPHSMLFRKSCLIHWKRDHAQPWKNVQSVTQALMILLLLQRGGVDDGFANVMQSVVIATLRTVVPVLQYDI